MTSTEPQKILIDKSIVYPREDLEGISPCLVFENNRLTLTQFLRENIAASRFLTMRINGKVADIIEQSVVGMGRKKIVSEAIIVEDSLVELVDQNTNEILSFYRAQFCLENSQIDDPEETKLTRLRRMIG